MTDRRHANVVNVDEIKVREISQGRHRMRLRSMGRRAGSQALGAALTEVPPGAVSFPCHYHCGNEEAIYVLSGTGLARIGEERVRVRAGDWVALPPGARHAHQMLNDGSEPLTYLCVSTMSSTDVVIYPDSNKVNVFGAEPADERGLRHYGIYPREAGGDFAAYWDREPDAKSE